MSVSAANMAYLGALDRANRDAQTVLRNYGYVAPGAGGTYTTENLFGAFDPQTIIDPTTGEIDRAKFEAATKNISIGGTGRLADIQRQGADIEAEARAASAASGIKGGLSQQATSLAEYQAGKALSAGKSEFLTAAGEAYAPIGGAFTNLQTAKAEAATQAERQRLESERLAAESAKESSLFESLFGQPSATSPANQSTARPTTPGTRMYERRNGWQWLGKKGWKKT